MSKRLTALLLALLTALAFGLGLHSSQQTSATPPSHVDDLGMMLLEQSGGLYVLAVMQGSAADTSGIAPGDLLTTMEGAPLLEISQLESALEPYVPHRQLLLTVERDDDTLTVQLPLSIKKNRRQP